MLITYCTKECEVEPLTRRYVESRLLSEIGTGAAAKEIDRSHDHALDVVLDDNRISHLQRELLERPENYLRPVRVRDRREFHRNVDEDPSRRKAGRNRAA